MPSRSSLKWPTEYIESAVTPVTSRSFEESVLAFRPAKSVLKIMDEADVKSLLSRLARITLTFKREDAGIQTLRQSRALENLASTLRLLRREQKLSNFYRMIERWAESGSPWRVQYAQSLLNQTNHLKREATENWQRSVRGQENLRQLNRKELLQEFTALVERVIARCLQTKKLNGKPLGERIKQRYTHALISAVMKGAQETGRGVNTVHQSDRVRKLRSVSKKRVLPKPGELGPENSEEFVNYIQVGQEYMQKKKQKGPRRRRK